MAHVIQNESLKDFAARVQGNLRDGATGPLRIAKDVIRLGENWEARREEADGKTFAQWLTSAFGPLYRQRWWKARAEAVREFKGLAYRLHHDAAVRMLQSVGRAYWPAVWEEVNQQYHGANRRIPLSVSQLCGIVRGVTGSEPRPKGEVEEGDMTDAQRIDILRAQVVRLGGVPEA